MTQNPCKRKMASSNAAMRCGRLKRKRRIMPKGRVIEDAGGKIQFKRRGPSRRFARPPRSRYTSFQHVEDSRQYAGEAGERRARRRGTGVRAEAQAALAARVYRAIESQGAARNRARGGQVTRRSAGPCAAL